MGSLAASAAAIVAALSLVPAYLALHVGDEPQSMQKGDQSSYESDRAAIVHTQKIVQNLMPVMNATTTPSDTIARILRLRPPGVSVDHVSYLSGDKTTIIIGGSAKSRQGVSGYRDALAADSRFKNVFVPIADLIGAENQGFSITISGDF